MDPMQTNRFPAVADAQKQQRKRLEYAKPHVILSHAQQIAGFFQDKQFRCIDVVLTEGNPADLLGLALAGVLQKMHDKDVLCVPAEPRDPLARVLVLRHGFQELVVNKNVVIVDVTIHPRLKLLANMRLAVPFTLVAVAVFEKGIQMMDPKECGVKEFLIVSDGHDLRSTSVEMPSPFAKK